MRIKSDINLSIIKNHKIYALYLKRIMYNKVCNIWLLLRFNDIFKALKAFQKKHIVSKVSNPIAVKAFSDSNLSLKEFRFKFDIKIHQIL